MATTFVLYGATGYTGELIARMAAARGLQPVLAGRSRAGLSRLAAELGLPYRVFDLADATGQLGELRSEVGAVLHCAGPFVQTAAPMVDACLRAGMHYLDITGEWSVFADLAARGTMAAAAGVTLLPGVGFDVVPTDCLAAHVAARLPGAIQLALAVQTVGGARVSRGTARTVLRILPQGGRARRSGRLVPVTLGSRQRVIDLGQGPVRVANLPLPELVTAYHSTGIADIDTYMAMPGLAARALPVLGRLGGLVAWEPVRRLLERRIQQGPPGPTATERPHIQALVWAEATDGRGGRAVARLRTPETYWLTGLAALAAVERVRTGTVPVGFQTPATAFGADFVLSLPGVTRSDAPD